MTIKRAFIDYLESLGYGTFGTDLYLNGVPLNAPASCWWVLATGGANAGVNQSGERLKNYIFNVYYRNTDAQVVDETLHEFEERLNSIHCDQLGGFETVDISVTTFPSDQDLDNTDRTIGLAQVTVKTYL